jgi:hypothetical protein
MVFRRAIQKVLCLSPPRWPKSRDLAQFVSELGIPIRGLSLAHDLAQTCALCALQLLADEGVHPEGLPSDLPSWRQMDRTRPAESLGASALAKLDPPGVRVAE